LQGTYKNGSTKAPDRERRNPMTQKTEVRPKALDLEIEELEVSCNPGCGTSTTSRLCTCPISASTTSSLFTAKTVR
jgi:hypothetical protein